MLGPCGGALMNGINALPKEVPESLPSLPAMGGHSKKTTAYEPGSGPLLDLDLNLFNLQNYEK